MLRERGLTLATMESCTGGLLASTITDVPGSSDYFKGGLVSYATEMKLAWGVSREVVETHGVISAECAREMARVARERLSADVGIGVTGVAGPDEQEGKPVGTIHIALDDGSGEARVVSYQFAQSREMVKRRAVTAALSLLRRTLTGSSRLDRLDAAFKSHALDSSGVMADARFAQQHSALRQFMAESRKLGIGQTSCFSCRPRWLVHYWRWSRHRGRPKQRYRQARYRTFTFRCQRTAGAPNWWLASYDALRTG